MENHATSANPVDIQMLLILFISISCFLFRDYSETFENTNKRKIETRDESFVANYWNSFQSCANIIMSGVRRMTQWSPETACIDL